MPSFTVALAALLASTMAAPLPLFKLDAATTEMFQARAIDGTPAAFYYQQGSGDNANDWVVYFEGGGWCYSLADCYGRSKGSLGSSSNLAPTVSLGGLLSSDCSQSPLCNYNIIYMKYLDGNSFSGLREGPVMYNNGTADVPLWFRGRAIIDAVLYAVEANIMKSPNLLRNARHVVETGCSAGGLATYLHADYIYERVPHTGAYFSAPISGFFVDYPSVSGPHVYGDEIRSIYGISNASTNADCQAFYRRTNDDWKCNMAQYVYDFVKAPLFILNSHYDSWQTGCILTSEPVTSNPYANGNCSATPGWNACARTIANCSAAQITNTMVPFGRYMDDTLRASRKFGEPGQGGFISSCHTHCEAQGGDFDTFKIGDATMVQAFTTWMEANMVNRAPSGPNWHFDCAYSPTGNHQCNPTCPVSEEEEMLFA